MGEPAKKLEPKGELISKREIAKRCKLHVQTVSSRLDDLGYEPDASATEKNQVYWFTPEMEFAIKAAKDEFAATKLRGMRADAETKELKLAQQRGELVQMSEAVEMVQAIVSTLYQEYTVRQPKRIAGKLAQAKNVMAVKKVLKVDSDRIMKGLRENFDRFLA